MMWSPHDIEVMFHYHCTRAPWRYGYTGAHNDSLVRLQREGLLTQEPQPTSTPKGAAFVDLICSTPIPIEKYVDPRFKEAA